MQQRVNLVLGALLLTYLTLGFLYATRTPPWQAPDEPAHYNYVRQLAAGDLPLMEPGDYDQVYQSTVISSQFDPQYSVVSFEYEDYQPPLYYLLLTPSYLLTSGAIAALRLTSLLIGLGVVILAYLTTRNIAPNHPWLAIAVAAFVALLPQHLSMLSSINNDALAELLIAAMLYVMTKPTPFASKQSVLALLLGLAFLTKVTAYLMAGVVGVFLLWHFWGDWRALWRSGLRLFAPALLIGLMWWGRNAVVYGNFDFLGTQTHDAIVVGQPTTREWVTQFGAGEVLRRFWRTSFQSFFGQFGWMCCPLPGWAYVPLRLMTLLAVVGGGWWLAFRPKSAQTKTVLIIFGTLLGLNLLLYVTYNLLYVQHQGRYLFASLIPIGTGFAVGLSAWLTPLPRSRQLDFLVPIGLTIGFVAINLYVILNILPCSLTRGGC